MINKFFANLPVCKGSRTRVFLDFNFGTIFKEKNKNEGRIRVSVKVSVRVRVKGKG